MGSPTYADLAKMTDAELVERHNRQAGHTVLGLDFYAEELVRRQTARQTASMEKQTATIRVLTWVVTAAGVVSALAAVVSTVAVVTS